MSEIKSKFDVRDQGAWAEFKNTIRFSTYVVMTFLAWFFYGGMVRRAYNKAVKEEREYFVDHMPGGKRPK